LTLAFTAFAIHALGQTAFSGAGIIESTTGGFKFPDGSVQLSATTASPNYLGEFCWLFGTDESLTLFRLGITSEGDGHHSVNGHVTERQPGEAWESSGPITGNMEIIGDERIMTLHSSDIDGFPPEESLLVSSVFHLRLDGATLDGNAYGIISFYNLTNEFFEPREAGGPIEIQYLPDCIVP
jgi:hypothetical protein